MRKYYLIAELLNIKYQWENTLELTLSSVNFHLPHWAPNCCCSAYIVLQYMAVSFGAPCSSTRNVNLTLHITMLFYASSTQFTLATSSTRDHLKRQSSCSSVSTDKSICTRPSCADRYHLMLGIVIFVLHSLVGWSFHVRKQATANAASLLTVPLCGTVCRTTCGYWTCR